MKVRTRFARKNHPIKRPATFVRLAPPLYDAIIIALIPHVGIYGKGTLIIYHDGSIDEYPESLQTTLKHLLGREGKTLHALQTFAYSHQSYALPFLVDGLHSFCRVRFHPAPSKKGKDLPLPTTPKRLPTYGFLNALAFAFCELEDYGSYCKLFIRNTAFHVHQSKASLFRRCNKARALLYESFRRQSAMVRALVDLGPYLWTEEEEKPTTY